MKNQPTFQFRQLLLALALFIVFTVPSAESTHAYSLRKPLAQEQTAVYLPLVSNVAPKCTKLTATVFGTQMYGDTVPDRFGTLAGAALTLFQVMTLEGWADAVLRPVMEIHPLAWAFFIPFILVTTFAIVNLLVGLVVNSMQEANEADKEADLMSFEAEVLKRLEAIEARLVK